MRWSAVVLVGCVGSTSDGDGFHSNANVCDGPLGLTLGTGSDAFAPVVEGATLPLVHGPQGGWHVETAGLVTGVTDEVGVVPRLVLTDTGQQIAGEQQAQLLGLVGYSAEACEGTFFGVRAFVDDPFATFDTGDSAFEFICSLAGARATYTLEVQDLHTSEASSGSVGVVLALDPADIPYCQ